MKPWLVLNSGSCAPAFNMAMDEALLEAMPRLQQPVLRFYGWTLPAATFGYFQKFGEVSAATKLRPLIRRPTGGGVVPHDADWTYSAVFPAGHEWHSLKAEDSYRRIHEWIQAAFSNMEVPTALAPCCKKVTLGEGGTGQCFVGHEKHDLLWSGRKIAGAAQRRNKLGLLIQGSVQPPPIPLERADWEKAMKHAGMALFGVQSTNLQPDSTLTSAADVICATKYSTPTYNEKR
ncbi:MAG: lipoate--protein ligase family protein [Verrucomicrobia bacterium]|nr:lipoate--protein ligase family protein [Verrucomicrobiota bacterium]